MRAIWTGSIAFGLVNVPVKAYGATEDHDIDLHQVHGKDGGRIRYERRCEVCGKKVAYKDLDKAYEDGERTIVLTDEDLEELPAEKSREIEVVQFVPAEQIDPLMLEKSYFLQADSKSPKAYELLRRTLEDTQKLAVVRFALRQKTRLGILRVRSKTMVLQAVMWADELRDADSVAPEKAPRISQQELKMSSTLVEQYSSDFTPEEFHDDYQDQLRALIEAKIEQGDELDTEATFGAAESGSGSGEVIDLMEALKRSIEGRGANAKKARATKAPAKKNPTKKKAAEKSASSSSPSKKKASS
ncbi:non-homologous end joining protein Ku [Glutamicibacter halophytocola]|uniref:non-homologous end joining protein Ku n=1 Tax=Glutamicibacter halophytocola TaxID=1933880 RepID=UPI0015589C2C|nr:Ku protein [Glutamicibacter halophytocola]NQD42039.1 Ku protein [Glutamicibacter halophytocola]